MVTRDQAVPLDSRHEPGRRRRTHVEDLGDVTHRHRPVAVEPEEQAHLAQRQVAHEWRRYARWRRVEDADQVGRRVGQAPIRPR
jgi:hypothetical protein